VIAAALLATFASGCGGSSRASAPTTVTAVGSPPPNVVTARQLAAYPASSAAHALLELWQAIEFSDVEAARGLVAPSTLTALRAAGFAHLVQAIGDNVPGLKILNSRTIAANTIVRAYLVFYTPSDNVAATSPMSFVFRRQSGEYKLTDLSYLLRKAREIRVAQRRASSR
jgi:hypothetical protein